MKLKIIEKFYFFFYFFLSYIKNIYLYLNIKFLCFLRLKN